jgi:class 3 adenylate cyclase
MQHEPLTGTVTFLFTDIEGSTRLLQELGDGYADVLVEHRRALRKAWRQHDGIEVDTQGDAFRAVHSAGQRRCRGRRVVSIDRSSYDRPTDD